MKMKTESEVMWRPKLGNETQMDEFRCHVNKKFDLKLGEKSVKDLPIFFLFLRNTVPYYFSTNVLIPCSREYC